MLQPQAKELRLSPEAKKEPSPELFGDALALLTLPVQFLASRAVRKYFYCSDLPTGGVVMADEEINTTLPPEDPVFLLQAPRSHSGSAERLAFPAASLSRDSPTQPGPRGHFCSLLLTVQAEKRAGN